MSDFESRPNAEASEAQAAVAARKRPRPGERRVQILQALAAMLEQPGGERVTTAALAARLGVSEAALYRHFASKAQMFEALIEFIEQSVFTLVRQIAAAQPDQGRQQAAGMVSMLLQFGEKNPGMARVMVGDALVHEKDRLQQRMNLFFDKFEAALRQSLRDAGAAAGASAPSFNAQIEAAVLTAFVVGRLQRFARSGFRRSPTENADACLARMVLANP